MDVSRRGFLKLLGIGGAAAAATPNLLFSGGQAAQLQDQSLRKALVGGDHFVFDGKAPRLHSHARARYLLPEGGFVSLRGPSAKKFRVRSPKRDEFEVRGSSRREGWTPYGEPFSYQSKPFQDPDPMIAFFMAAENLRDEISKSAEGLNHMVMVTCVDMPIMAMPLPDKGFYLECQITQFVCIKSELLNADQALSTSGEVPIETPDAITMKQMIHLQEELKAMGIIQPNPPRVALREARRRLGRRGLLV